MSKLDDVILTVEDVATEVDCTAHVVDRGCNRAGFCVSPHDEDAGWAGDLRITWNSLSVTASLEHSGPIGRITVDQSKAGWQELRRWLVRELG